jgi:hypothetical protein
LFLRVNCFKCLSFLAQAAIELSYEHFPKTTVKTLDLIAKVGTQVGNGLDVNTISITFKYSCLFIKYFNFLRQLTTRQLLKISHNLPVTRPFKNFSTIRKPKVNPMKDGRLICLKV